MYFLTKLSTRVGKEYGHRHYRLALRVLRIQFSVLCIMFLAVPLSPELRSLFMGGLVAAVGSFAFFMKAYKYQKASQVKEILGSFYSGEAIKFILVVLGFLLVFRYGEPERPMAVIVGFVIIYFMFWLTPLMERELKAI